MLQVLGPLPPVCGVQVPGFCLSSSSIVAIRGSESPNWGFCVYLFPALSPSFSVILTFKYINLTTIKSWVNNRRSENSTYTLYKYRIYVEPCVWHMSIELHKFTTENNSIFCFFNKLHQGIKMLQLSIIFFQYSI